MRENKTRQTKGRGDMKEENKLRALERERSATWALRSPAPARTCSLTVPTLGASASERREREDAIRIRTTRKRKRRTKGKQTDGVGEGNIGDLEVALSFRCGKSLRVEEDSRVLVGLCDIKRRSATTLSSLLSSLLSKTKTHPWHGSNEDLLQQWHRGASPSNLHAFQSCGGRPWEHLFFFFVRQSREFVDQRGSAVMLG